MLGTTADGEREDGTGLDLRAGRLVFQAFQEDDEEHLLVSDDLPRIPGFDVIDRIGEGGGGEVYYGARTGTLAPVAIKILRRPSAVRSAHAPDWREVDLLRRLRLHCVPRIHEFGTADGAPFIVTDFVDGVDLATWSGAHGRTRRERIGMLAKVADAVQLLHERGVIHRDLKPANIIVDEHGEPIILDFGLAEMTDRHDEAHASASNEVRTPTRAGTPAYMAPEQARGDADAVSTRSDVYGLAATAFAILLGRPPHQPTGSAAEQLRLVAESLVPAGRDIDPTLPRELEAILARGLSPHPSQRYASAGDLGADLRRWLTNEPVEALELSAPLRLLAFARRRPGRVAAAVLVVFLLGAVAVTGGWAMNESYEKSVALSDLAQFEVDSQEDLNEAYDKVRDWNTVAIQEWQKKVNYARSVRIALQDWIPAAEEVEAEGTIIDWLELFQAQGPLYEAEFVPEDLKQAFHDRWVDELEKYLKQMGETMPNGASSFYRALRDAVDRVADANGM